MFSLLSIMPFLAQGSQTIELQPKSGLAADLAGLKMPSIVSALIRLTVVIAALVFFFMLVIGGIQWIVSGGDKAQAEAARGRITSALIGLVIVFAAWAIVSLINTFFNVNIFQLAIPSVSTQ